MSRGYFFGTSSVKLHSSETRCLTLNLVEDHLFFVCGNSLCSWDLESDESEILIEKLPARVEHAAFGPESAELFLIGGRGLYIFDPDKRTVRFRCDLILPPEDTISAFAMSRDGSKALVASHQQVGLHIQDDLSIRLWDLDALEPMARLVGHERHIAKVLFTPDGSRIITSSQITGDHGFFSYESPRYRIWSTIDGSCTSSFGGEKGIRLTTRYSEPWDQLSSSCLGVSPNGKTGIFEADSRIALVDLATWRIIQRFDTGADRIQSASFSDDGDYVFALGSNQAFYAWSRATGELERVIGGFSNEAREFVVKSDSESFITTHRNIGYEGWLYRRQIFPKNDE